MVPEYVLKRKKCAHDAVDFVPLTPQSPALDGQYRCRDCKELMVMEPSGKWTPYE
jgi:hypothetical protein